MISCGARLAVFDIAELREVTSYDELELDTLGDRKTALFLIMSDTDDSFNFLISMCYTQLFNLLCEKADDVYGGRLPVHVRCLIDECANIGQIPKLEKLVATIRSREISACLVLQAQSQLKAIYKDNADTIIGNMDTSIFLGGKEPTTLKELAAVLGKETIDTYNTGESRGRETSHSLNYQKLGKELVDAGKLVDVKAFLQENDRYDKFYPTALKYQEFTDGSMYTLPLEYHVEMTWYNKEIFDQYNLTPPKTMDEWLNVCKTLSDNGITPISVDGVDRWPVQRYLAMLPFRESGNDFIINLRDGKAKMNSETGIKAAEFMKEIGQYFNDGFAATDYATAQSMFLDGKSAMYYIGDWEIAAMQDAYAEGKIDYFYLPMTDDATTKENEFCVNSGIGMAFNAETFDEKTKDFVLYVIDHYGEMYAAKQQMTPIKAELSDEVDYSDLYLRIQEDMQNTGENFLKPWDTYLDADTNTVMQDNLLLLASGDLSVEDFCKLIDDSIAANAK